MPNPEWDNYAPLPEGGPPRCLRCDLTLTTAEIEKGGRWKEFCHPCREILQKKFAQLRES